MEEALLEDGVHRVGVYLDPRGQHRPTPGPLVQERGGPEILVLGHGTAHEDDLVPQPVLGQQVLEGVEVPVPDVGLGIIDDAGVGIGGDRTGEKSPK